MTTAALIVAAGRGTRAGGSAPKQFAPLGSATVLQATLDAFTRHTAVDVVLVCIGSGDRALYDEAVGLRHAKLLAPATGADTRQGSVLQGLLALEPHAPRHVLIHDAVRPFVTSAIIDRVVAGLAEAAGAVAAIPVADSLKRADAAGGIAATIDRSQLWRAQTPQGFRFADILAAHRRAAASGRSDFTDDAAVAEWAGMAVRLVLGSEGNRKLTTAEDLAMAQAAMSPQPDVRTGQGFDVHRFVAGDHVWLGGVRIPHTHALQGHSDADAALHALTDALLGAIGDDDIGQHFPDTDPRWKGAPSHLFLADAARRVHARGGTITHADLTILCEAPRIGPHRDAMRARIAEVLGIDAGRVAVKATTTERLGFTGRGEGLAALAIATVILR